MELIKWRPTNELMNFHKNFDSIFNDFFSPSSSRFERVASEVWNPKVDIFDDGDHFVITAELPGLEKKDIKVDVDGHLLTITGERTIGEEEDKKNYYRRERFYGKFERAFTLPDSVDPEKIKANHKEGILTLEIPKPEEQKPRQIAVH